MIIKNVTLQGKEYNTTCAATAKAMQDKENAFVINCPIRAYVEAARCIEYAIENQNKKRDKAKIQASAVRM